MKRKSASRAFRTHLKKRPRRKVTLRKITGYFGWRFGDAFMLRGNARQYDQLIARKHPCLYLFGV